MEQDPPGPAAIEPMEPPPGASQNAEVAVQQPQPEGQQVVHTSSDLPTATAGMQLPHTPGEEILGTSSQTPASAEPGPPPKARSIKTPLQKEALEAAFQVNKFPDEDVRRMLGDRIGLKEQQVQVWFSHKRRKEKKEQEDAAIRAAIDQRHAQEVAVQPEGNASISEPAPMDVSMPPPPTALPLEAQIPKPLAAPAPASQPIEQLPVAQGANSIHFQAPPAPSPTVNLKAEPEGAHPVAPVPEEEPEAAPALSASVQRTLDLAKAPAPELSPEERAQIPALIALAKTMLPVAFRDDGPPLVYEFDDPPLLRPDLTYADEEPTLKRKRVDGEDEDSSRYPRLALGPIGGKAAPRYEVEKLEKEKRRNEEKAERDRRKQEAARTKEEMRLRALQEREEKKAQAQAEKDRRAQERKEKIDERRREKEKLKAMQAQEKQATRLRQRDAGTGPRDDLDIEWEALVAAQREAGYTSGTEGEAPRDPQPLVRPEFPPPSLGFQRLLPAELEGGLGGDLLFVWSFLHSFGELLGIGSLTVGQLLQCLVDGKDSRLLGELHIAMLRIVHADMEEAHATGAMQSGSAINFLDRAIVSCAAMLEEAWAWGFDVDAWRAHLNALTWPEVLRQMAITWGMGPRRPKPKKEVKPKMGTDGEDVITDESGSLKLRLPPRFGVGTVKAAAWQVLAETGPEGLMIAEIARRIQQSGLRDLRTSKTPEASVAGALSRDVIFARTAPATYALQAVVTFHSKLTGDASGQAEGKGPGHAASSGDPSTSKKVGEGAAVKEEPRAAAVTGEEEDEEKKSEEREEEDEGEGESSGEEDEAPEEKTEGQAWVRALQCSNYSDMGLGERVTILAALVHLAIDGPTIRNTLEARVDEAGRVRKQMWEEAKLEKKRRQAEAAEKAKTAALEAQKVMEMIRSKEGSAAPSEAAPAGIKLEANGALPPTSQGNGEDVKAVVGSARSSPDPGQKRGASLPASRTEQPARRGSDANEADGLAAPEEMKATPAPTLERTNSGISPSEGGFSRKGDGEDDLSAAAVAKQKQLQRAETIRKAEEANAIRGDPFGLDRRYNKYWRFVVTENASGDDFAGRLVVESSEDGTYRMLGSAEGLDGLIAALDKRGARESQLYNALLSHRDEVAQAMPAEPMKMPAERSQESQEQLQAEQSAWIQEVSTAAAKAGGNGVKGSSPGDEYFEKLRGDLLAVEQALPEAATRQGWDSAAWRESVRLASSSKGLREALAELESAVEDAWISPAFRRVPLLVRGAWLHTGREVASALPGNNGEVQQLPQKKEEEEEMGPEDQSPLGWLPETTAAVALRLQTLDASLQYSSNSLPAREQLLAYKYTQRPVRRVPVDGGTAAPKLPCREILGQPIGLNGRAVPTLTPAFPLALMSGERQGFRVDWRRLQKQIADEKAGILPPPTIPSRQSLQPTIETVGRGTRARNAKATKPGKAKGSKASKAKSKQSALREEFDRQSEEEEAAERRGFSTPGFSDDDSDFGQRYGRGAADEEMEISD